MVVHIGIERPPRTLRRPKPLFATAKTGTGMSQVFVHVARRIVMHGGRGSGDGPNLIGKGGTVHRYDREEEGLA
jgi:hypothetical protein